MKVCSAHKPVAFVTGWISSRVRTAFVRFENNDNFVAIPICIRIMWFEGLQASSVMPMLWIRTFRRWDSFEWMHLTIFFLHIWQWLRIPTFHLVTLCFREARFFDPLIHIYILISHRILIYEFCKHTQRSRKHVIQPNPQAILSTTQCRTITSTHAIFNNYKFLISR